jgi:hypothetical protein
MDKKAWALAHARRGYRVFPCKPNQKIPCFAGWQEHATTDTDLIEAWWSGMYKDANIGIATGRGLIVLDFDTKNNKAGLKSLEEMDMLGLPWGHRVQTPSGGVHVYLSYDESKHFGTDLTTISADSIPGYPGLDVRCGGGLVLGAGSTIDGVAYVDLGP